MHRPANCRSPTGPAVCSACAATRVLPLNIQDTTELDFNGLQISGKVQDIMDMTPIDEHFKAFGWAVRNIDGNDMSQVVDALDLMLGRIEG